MKRYSIFLLMLFVRTAVNACPACEKAQPRLLRGIVHGAGPDSRWDYLIVWLAVIATLFTLFYSIKWLIHPGESAATHIKHTILQHDSID